MGHGAGGLPDRDSAEPERLGERELLAHVAPSPPGTEEVAEGERGVEDGDVLGVETDHPRVVQARIGPEGVRGAVRESRPEAGELREVAAQPLPPVHQGASLRETGGQRLDGTGHDGVAVDEQEGARERRGTPLKAAELDPMPEPGGTPHPLDVVGDRDPLDRPGAGPFRPVREDDHPGEVRVDPLPERAQAVGRLVPKALVVAVQEVDVVRPPGREGHAGF